MLPKVPFIVVVLTILFNKIVSKSLGTIHDPDKLYYISAPKEKASFLDAVARCYHLRMEAASIDTVQEQEELVKLIESSDDYYEDNDFWMGATSLLDENNTQFSWFPSGKLFEYHNVGNLIKWPLPDHNCAKFYYASSGSTLLTEDCFKKLRFACKKIFPVNGFSSRAHSNMADDEPMEGQFNNLKDKILTIGDLPRKIVSDLKGALVKIQDHIVATASDAVLGLQRTIKNMKYSFQNAGWSVADNFSNTIKMAKKTLEVATSTIGNALNWGIEKTKEMLQASFGSVDNIYNAQPKGTFQDMDKKLRETVTQSLLADP